jgi:proline iminopeptidase
MKIERWVWLLLLVVAAGYLSCSPPDVRIGMGDGDGVRLAYRALGTGKPLVVIHDGPGNEKSIMYKGFDGLHSDIRLVYYDQRGCGKSEPLAATTPSGIEDNVRDLESLRRYLRLEKMSLAAHGWGAVIALEYTRAHPTRVESLILITPISPFRPGPKVESIVDRLPDDARDHITSILNNVGLSVFERQAAIMRTILPSLFFRPEAMEGIRLESLKYAPEVSLRLGEELQSLDLFAVLHEIAQPTLVIVGRHDLSVPVRDQMAYTDGITNASAVVFNESGHFPFLEERGFFLNLVREFLLKNNVPALAHVGGAQ